MSLQDCLKMEYNMVVRCNENNDFPEGKINAISIKKHLKKIKKKLAAQVILFPPDFTNIQKFPLNN